MFIQTTLFFLSLAGLANAAWQQPSTPTASKLWNSIAIASSDGMKGLAGTTNNYLFITADAGDNWVEDTSIGSKKTFGGVAVSDDGTKMYAAANDYLYKSIDSGANWIMINVTNVNETINTWSHIVCSADGSVVVASEGTAIHVSTDSAASFSAGWGSNTWKDLTISSDGTKIFAVAEYREIYRSTDSGATFAIATASLAKQWATISCSADGDKLIAAVKDQYVYTSVNTGVNWTAITSLPISLGFGKHWSGVDISDDGVHMLASLKNDYLQSSNDSGTTWVNQSDSFANYQSWYGVSMTGDGLQQFAVAYSGSISYRSMTASPTSMPSSSPTSVPSSMPTVPSGSSDNGLEGGVVFSLAILCIVAVGCAVAAAVHCTIGFDALYAKKDRKSDNKGHVELSQGGNTV